MADNQVHARLSRCCDHRRAFVERDRHRFFNEHVLPRRRSDPYMRGMKLVRRRNVHDLHLVIAAERLDCFIDRNPKVLLEARTR